MNLQEWIDHYYLEEHYNCSETILRAANQYYHLGLDNEAMKVLSGFGSGMYTGLTCGALISCTAVLSKMLIQTKAHDQLDTFRPVIQKCVRNFKEELHDTECRNIRKTWYDPKLHCVHTVQAAGKALEKTINELHNT